MAPLTPEPPLPQKLTHSWALGTIEHDFCGGGAVWDSSSRRYYAAVITKPTDGEFSRCLRIWSACMTPPALQAERLGLCCNI